MSKPATTTRRAGGVLLALLAGLFAALMAASPAYAHATLLGTDPVDGAVVATAPAQVTLTFNEPVTVRAGGVRLLDAQGAQVSAEARSVDTKIVLAVPAGAADGTYIVSWRVVSADDHPISGGFSFSIGAPTATGVTAAPAAPQADPAVQTLRRAAQAVLYLGVLLATGLVVFAMFTLTAGTAILSRRLRRATLGSAVAAAVAAVVSIPATIVWQDGTTLAALADGQTWQAGLSSDTALSTLLTIIGLAIALLAARTAVPADAATTTAPARHRALTRLSLAAAGSALALGSLALVGHTRTFGPAWLVVSSDLLHLGTAAVWLGGLTGLALTLTRSSDLPTPAAVATVAGFSLLAAGLLAVLALAGTVLAWRILGSWDALFGTAYGRSLLIKIGIAVAVVALAAYNRWRLVPQIGAHDSEPARKLLSRTVRAEALLLTAAVAVTGVLVTQSPLQAPAPAQAAPGAPAAPKTLEAPLGSGKVVARLTPGALGVNSLELTLLAADGNPLQPIEVPTLALTMPAADIGPLAKPLSAAGPGRYEAVIDLPLAGTWQLTIAARTGKYDSASARLTVEIR
ncbi:copper resistance CopC/CopD family protein [Catellatospora methionotrophica]|uniref:copper resistance CopC/CopD family protein n=1 Tax=Catellatospora methionotrophica TaxID=121620 RepID=UPI0033C134AB